MTGSTGSATISGSGSTWTATLGVTVGGAGDGKLRIDGGGTVNSPSDVPGAAASYIAQGYNSMSTVAVDGAGSTWTNGANLSIGAAGTGTLSITGDGAVTAASLSIGSTSLAAIDVGRCSSLTVGGGTGAITNNGAVRILAGAGVPTGGNYRPISAGTWGGSGTVQAVGGTWNAGSQQFTASAVVPATSGTPVQFDLSRQQRALISDAATGWSVGASFLASSSSKPLDFVATTVSGSTLTALEGLLPAKQSVVGAWSFLATSGYESGDPAYLSFDVGSASELEAWQYNGTSWTQYDPTDLTDDGTYASFTVTSLGDYAVSAVPESSTITLLIAGAACLLGYAWRWRLVA